MLKERLLPCLLVVIGALANGLIFSGRTVAQPSSEDAPPLPSFSFDTVPDYQETIFPFYLPPPNTSAGAAQSSGDIATSELAAPLSADEVTAILQGAAASLDVPLTVAVVDRVGNILGIYRKANAPAQVSGNFFNEPPPLGGPQDANEVAVSLARTGAFFSNNQAPLSSRTVRFVSGIHFPPGIRFTPNAALYGIENTNRGCDFNVTFNPDQFVPRATSAESAINHLPCNEEDQSGCCNSVDKGGCGLGIITGKIDLFDSDFRAVNTGGVPIFRGKVLLGGVGVVGDFSGEIAEFAAISGILAGGVLPVPDFLSGNELALRSIVVFIDGIRLPFVDKRLTEKLDKGILQRPKGTSPGTADGAFVFGPNAGSCYDPTPDDNPAPDLDANGTPQCLQAPEGYLVGPLADPNGKLTAEEVDLMVQQAVDTANRTRAVIRLPIGQRTKMVISVSNADGEILAIFRMPDATIFSIDVATAKARNVAYFSSFAPTVANDLPGLPPGTAVTNRTISFASQPFYPAGIDTSSEGPFFYTLYVPDTVNACTQGSQEPNPNQTGIVFFPGSLPIYKNGELIGGLGVSGDGVEQDDFVTVGGAQGFEPAKDIRADNFFIRGVRQAYLKFPRNPER
jgi:uncharacterized protein GlcG (DUF336 family)